MIETYDQINNEAHNTSFGNDTEVDKEDSADQRNERNQRKNQKSGYTYEQLKALISQKHENVTSENTLSGMIENSATKKQSRIKMDALW